MDSILRSADGAEPIRLGESRERLQEVLGAYREFRRSESSGVTDHFLETGPMITYDGSGQAAAIEFAPPAQVVVQGVELIGSELPALIADLKNAGVRIDVIEDGAVLLDYGAQIYAPDSEVEGVMIGDDSAA